MTSRWNIVVAALESEAALAEDVQRRLTRAWSAPTPCTLTASRPEDLHDQSLRQADALVLIAPRATAASDALPMLDLADAAGVPVLALLDGPAEPGNPFEFAAALVAPLHGDDHHLCALLRGLLHRQSEIKRLRSEAALNQRFHGGLKGQITKMHEELQLAAMVQREFLPREIPAMHGMEFAALWRPTNYVSGDIYDVARLDDDHVGVFVADAVGHGVPAALMTMVICRSLVTKEITGNSYRIVPPAEVLARLNTEMIRRQGHTTRFATAVYAVIDCRRRLMQLAGAGHPPPLRLAADGTSHALETSGGLLGIFADEHYDQVEIELALHDRLLFYTDGFEQAFPAVASDSHLRRMPSNVYRSEFDQLRRLATAPEMIDVINQRLDDQAGSLHQVDDLTLVCAHAGDLCCREAPPIGEPQTIPLRGPRTSEVGAKAELRLAS